MALRAPLILSRSIRFFPQGLGVSDIFVEYRENLGILSDQTRIYLKDIVFGHQCKINYNIIHIKYY